MATMLNTTQALTNDPYPACTGASVHRFELRTRNGLILSETCVWCGHTEKYND